MKPQRIQRKRARGWTMPPNTVYVGRPTKWGNPYHLKDGLSKTPSEVVEYYRDFVIDGTCYVSFQTPPTVQEIQTELRGKNLACWCKPGEPCHADVLLEIANS